MLWFNSVPQVTGQNVPVLLKAGSWIQGFYLSRGNYQLPCYLHYPAALGCSACDSVTRVLSRGGWWEHLGLCFAATKPLCNKKESSGIIKFSCFSFKNWMSDWIPCSDTRAVGVCVQRGPRVGPSHREVLGVGRLEARVKSDIWPTSADGYLDQSSDFRYSGLRPWDVPHSFGGTV